MKGTQKLLDEFLSQLAIDLPKFMGGTDKGRTDALLQTLGIDQQLSKLDLQIQRTFDERRDAARVAKKDKAYADGLPHHEDAPDEPVSITELIQQQQAILAKNGENQRKRERASEITRERVRIETQLADLKIKLAELQQAYDRALEDEKIATKDAAELHDESTAEIEESIANVEETNRRIRANLDKERAENEAKQLRSKYNNLTSELETIRKAKADLLNGADLPLPGLSVEDGVLTYNGQKWDCMSGAEQLIVATSIVRKLNPECGFVLMDKLEQMDLETLKEFGDWLEREGLQVIATRVSTGPECAVIIEDGTSTQVQAPEPEPNYDEF
jgi:hypothetical protein